MKTSSTGSHPKDRTARNGRLPARAGARPRTTPATPHLQLDQHGSRDLAQQLWRRMQRMEGVVASRSGISMPSTVAVHLHPDLAVGPDEAFMAGTEFAHLHGDGSGSLHLSLPLPVARDVIERGWGEPHPVVAMGYGPHNWVMLFGARDDAELQVVWDLVRSSYAFARGSLDDAGSAAAQ